MKRVIVIILATVIISASASAGATAYILDQRWLAYTDQLTQEYEQKQETWRNEAFARGFWRGTYEMCLVIFQGDTFVCLRGVRNGYKAGDHLKPASPSWDWFYIRYQGQVQ